MLVCLLEQWFISALNEAPLADKHAVAMAVIEKLDSAQRRWLQGARTGNLAEMQEAFEQGANPAKSLDGENVFTAIAMASTNHEAMLAYVTEDLGVNIHSYARRAGTELVSGKETGLSRALRLENLPAINAFLDAGAIPVPGFQGKNPKMVDCFKLLEEALGKKGRVSEVEKNHRFPEASPPAPMKVISKEWSDIFIKMGLAVLSHEKWQGEGALDSYKVFWEKLKKDYSPLIELTTHNQAKTFGTIFAEGKHGIISGGQFLPAGPHHPHL